MKSKGIQTILYSSVGVAAMALILVAANIITGAANYYQPRTLTRNNERISAEGDDYFFTDAISDEAVRQIRMHAATRAESTGRAVSAPARSISASG